MAAFHIVVPKSNAQLYLSDRAENGLVPFDILKSVGTLKVEIPNIKVPRGDKYLLFSAKEGGFYFAMELIYSGVRIYRNGVGVQVKVKPLSTYIANLFLYVAWDIEKLGVHASSSPTNIITKWFPIRRVQFPHNLLKQARVMSRNIDNEFPTLGEFHNATIEMFLSVKDDIESSCATTPFWYERSVNRKKRKYPKHETDSHHILELMLINYTMRNSIQLLREQYTGRGKVDFSFTGIVNGEGMRCVAVECKNAHSPDLEDGLLNQLPIYMNQNNAEFGIYCVLWFKGEHEARPKHYENPKYLHERLKNLLQRDKLTSRIRVVVLDVSIKPTASRIKRKIK